MFLIRFYAYLHGFLIRNYIKGFVAEGKIYNAYIPEIDGKERRKSTPSKEGRLGVEGMEDEIIEDVLRKYASEKERGEKITKSDLLDAGLYGGTDSAAARVGICRRLSIPTGISPGAFADAVNALMSRKEFFEMMGK